MKKGPLSPFVILSLVSGSDPPKNLKLARLPIPPHPQWLLGCDPGAHGQ